LSRPASKAAEVLAVERPAPGPRLRGGYLGVPAEGDEPNARELLLRGWALGAEKPALVVELVADGRVVGRAPVELERPDIAELHPDLPHAGRCGFEHGLNLWALDGELELELRAVLDPVTRAPLATVALRAATEAGVEPVSVVIPCFRQAHFLGEAIESVLAQTHPRIELIVVDDGSPDNVESVAGRYPGVRCLRRPNEGLAAARNAGLEQAGGEFVLFLDADDRLLPEAVATGLRELGAAPEAEMAAGTWRLIGEEGEPVPAAAPEVPEEAYPALLESCFISTPAAVLYRRRLFEQIGGFDPSVSASADYDVYLKTAARFPVRLHGEVVAEYRRHGANMTRDPALIMSAEIAVLERQAAEVRDQPALQEALEAGIARSRAYHGERMRALNGE
jgi:hypothetical protein